MTRRHDPATNDDGSTASKKSPQQIVLDLIVSRLHGVRIADKKAEFTALCPGHADRKPSLSGKVTQDGKLLLKCFRGCEQKQLIEVLGLELFYGVPVIEKYSYHDQDGQVLYEVCRTADKQFPPRLPHGEWGCGGKSVLYRLPELIQSMKEFPDAPVYICEGEKDVNRCWDVGLSPATCPRGGASAKWKSEFTKTLAGRDVVIFADNDLPGIKFAERIAGELYGKTKSIRIVEFQDLPEHGDVSDFLDAGHDANELLARVEATPLWTPGDRKKTKDDDTPAKNKPAGARYTDLQNSREFVKRFGHGVRYCPQFKCFYVWNGQRWARDNFGLVESYAKQIADQRWEEAKRADDAEARRFALRSASARGIESMLRLAQSELELIIQPDQFDTNPMLLNCANGTLELATGKLREHRQSDYVTKICDVAFNPGAEAPQWEKALDLIFNGDDELIGFVQRFIGYCLTGQTSEQVIALFVGAGSNGKSLVLLVLLRIIGCDYAIKASDDILLRRMSQAHPTALADLFGKRLAVVMETDAGDRLAEALIKALTGGDRIRARRMREDYWEFTPSHKIVLCTNHRPHVEATDHAFWRRIRLIPFGVSFWKEGDPGNEGKHLPKRLKADPQLAEKLFAEAEGILAWCVRGCLEWQKNGLGTTEAVVTATESYRREQDSLCRFVEEVCVVEASAKVSSSFLYSRYQSWCTAVGEQPTPQNQFKQRLIEQPFGIMFKRSDGSWFVGIKIRGK